MSNQRKNMDFVVYNFKGVYGYMSTGKEKRYGFTRCYSEVFEDMEKLDKNYTYATPEEIPFNDHQREWTKQDNIHLNKMKFFKMQYDIEFTKVLMQANQQRYDR